MPPETGNLEADKAESRSETAIFDNLSPTQECSTTPQLHQLHNQHDNRSPVEESQTRILVRHAQSSSNSNVATTPSSDTEYTTSLSLNRTNSPPFTPISSTSFRWGEIPGHIFHQDIIAAYEEQVSWCKNIFSPPTGHAGTEYVKEHTRLLRAYKDKTPLERVALTAIMVIPGYCCRNPMPKLVQKNSASTSLAAWYCQEGRQSQGATRRGTHHTVKASSH